MEPKLLRLTKHDEEIYSRFREEFPDLSIEFISEDVLKSADAKKVRRR